MNEEKEELNEQLKRLFVKEMKAIIAKIEKGECQLTAGQTLRALEVLGQEALSREEAANLTGDAPSTFAAKVKAGILPEGHKERGFKEKRWLKGELLTALFRIKKRTQ